MFLKYLARRGMQTPWPLAWEFCAWYSQLSVRLPCADVDGVRLHSYQVRRTRTIFFSLCPNVIASFIHYLRYWMWLFNAWFRTLLAIQIQFRCYGHTTASMVSSHMYFYIHDLLYDWVSHCSVGDDRWIVSVKGMRIDLIATGIDSFNCNLIRLNSFSGPWFRRRHDNVCGTLICFHCR